MIKLYIKIDMIMKYQFNFNQIWIKKKRIVILFIIRQIY